MFSDSLSLKFSNTYSLNLVISYFIFFYVSNKCKRKLFSQNKSKITIGFSSNISKSEKSSSFN